jgi:hypothetical protein
MPLRKPLSHNSRKENHKDFSENDSSITTYTGRQAVDHQLVLEIVHVVETAFRPSHPSRTRAVVVGGTSEKIHCPLAWKQGFDVQQQVVEGPEIHLPPLLMERIPHQEMTGLLRLFVSKPDVLPPFPPCHLAVFQHHYHS